MKTCNRIKHILPVMIYTAILMCLTYIIFPVHFETNDDGGLREIMAGYRTPSPYPKTVFTSTLYGQLVSSVYRLFPALPWYTLFFWGLLFISFICIFKSILKIGGACGIPRRYLFLVYTFVHIAFFTYYLWFLQFTVVSGICICGCIALVFSHSQKDSLAARISDLILICILCGFALLIRYLSVLAALPFFVLALLWQKGNVSAIRQLSFCQSVTSFIKNIFSPSGRKFFASVVFIGVFSCTLMIAYEHYFNSMHPEWEHFESYSYYRGLYTDFNNPSYEEAPELYDSIGWSPELQHLSKSWFMLDERISLENLRYIHEHKNEYQTPAASPEQNRQNIFATKIFPSLFLSQNKIPGYGFLFIIVTACISACFFLHRKMYLQACFIIINALGFSAVTVILIFLGRLPLRMYMCIFIPSALLILFQLVAEMHKVTAKTLAAGIPSLCLICLFYFSLADLAVENNRILQNMDLENHHETVSQYLAEHPDNIYLYDAGSYLLYPRSPLFTSPDQPECNLFFYGGSLANSPLFEEQLSATGHSELHAGSFAEDDVFFLYQVRYGKNTIFPSRKDGSPLSEEEQKAYVLDELNKTNLTRMLINDYNITQISITDTISDLYYVYQYKMQEGPQ